MIISELFCQGCGQKYPTNSQWIIWRKLRFHSRDCIIALEKRNPEINLDPVFNLVPPSPIKCQCFRCIQGKKHYPKPNESTFADAIKQALKQVGIRARAYEININFARNNKHISIDVSLS